MKPKYGVVYFFYVHLFQRIGDLFLFYRPKWKSLLQGISLGEDIEGESRKAALLLVLGALSDANKHLDLVVRSHSMRFVEIAN